MPPVTRRSVAAALALSCHPVPTLAVTIMATVLAVAAGNTLGTVVLVGLAVLTGQLSIGWSNDLLDADRDRVAGRTDKPVAAGAVGARVLVAALAATTGATVVFSVGLGWPAAVAALTVVVCGWLYNLGVKSSLLSPVVYAVAFGALPAIATLARPQPVLPPWWVVAAGALLGVGAHFGNVLPDLDDDRLAGVRGVPQRVGRAASAIAAAGAMAAAAAIVLISLPGRPSDVVDWVLFAAVLALAAFVVGAGRSGRHLGAAFVATMAAAGVCVAMLVVSGGLG